MRRWLRKFRQEAHLSEGAVAELVGISQVGYHWIETGQRNPGIDTAKRIGGVLGFPWTMFYEDEEKSDNVDAFARQ